MTSCRVGLASASSPFAVLFYSDKKGRAITRNAKRETQNAKRKTQNAKRVGRGVGAGAGVGGVVVVSWFCITKAKKGGRCPISRQPSTTKERENNLRDSLDVKRERAGTKTDGGKDRAGRAAADRRRRRPARPLPCCPRCKSSLSSHFFPLPPALATLTASRLSSRLSAFKKTRLALAATVAAISRAASMRRSDRKAGLDESAWPIRRADWASPCGWFVGLFRFGGGFVVFGWVDWGWEGLARGSFCFVGLCVFRWT